MPSFGSARSVFGLVAVPISSYLRRPLSLRLCSSYFPSESSHSTRTHWQLLRRTLSSTPHYPKDLFHYTSGRWLVNDVLRHEERRFVFDVGGLCKLAAQSVGQGSADVVNISKLAEGGFNRTFLITLRDGFQMVARIPYPVTVPKHYAVASEVATMDFLRSSGLPVPRVHGYSTMSDNAAGTEYILMDFVRGTTLSDIWLSLDEQEISSILRQLAQLESRMMSIAFPAGGSLYYARDLMKEDIKAAIPLKTEGFCVGPDVRLPLWYGRRSQLRINRGPYESLEAVLARAAHKEIAYLEHFGQPLLPFERQRREGYGYQKQLPSAHIENLKRYLLIAPSLIPRNAALHQFRIRHPDLKQSNIIVSKSPDSGWQIISLLDWQHASILPSFLLASIPNSLQNYDDQFSQSLRSPSLPENLGELNKLEQMRAQELYRRRLIHYEYVKNTAKWNELHYEAMSDPASIFLYRLFTFAGSLWEGETLALKVALIQATEDWESLTGGGTPCPVTFDAEDVRETMKLDEVQRSADETFERVRAMIDFESETWVLNTHYDEAIARAKQLKEAALAAATDEVQAEIMAHWLLDDMDEMPYM